MPSDIRKKSSSQSLYLEEDTVKILDNLRESAKRSRSKQADFMIQMYAKLIGSSSTSN